MEEHVVETKKRGKGSFWASRTAIQALLELRASAMQIGAYLVLARYTDAHGKFSSAGRTAIRNALGVGDAMADRALEALQRMTTHGQIVPGDPGKSKLKSRLLYMPAQWKAIHREAIPERPTERAKVRWVLNDSRAVMRDRVWFSNELVDGFGRFRQPLKRLKRHKDVAARLLLRLYEQNDMEQFGGVSPCPNVFVRYDMVAIGPIGRSGLELWLGHSGEQRAYGACQESVLGPHLPDDEDDKQQDVRPFWRALEALKSSGFIYEVVTVMDGKENDPDAQPIYTLNTRSKHGYKPKGEEGLAGDMARVAGRIGYPVTDSMGRFYGKYAAVVPVGMRPHIIGIYRLRFRVSNPKNHTVKSAWSRIRQCNDEAREWVRELKAENSPTPDAA